MARRISAPSPRANLGGAVTVEVKGLREYQEKLVALGEGMLDKGCVIALAAGANVLRDAAKSRAPVLQRPDARRTAGTVRNAVSAMHVKAKATQFAVTYVIGVRLLKSRAINAFKKRTGRQAKDNPHDPFYAPIIEMGQTPRTRHPFLKPGFQAAGEAAVKVSRDKLGQFTEREIRRLGAQKP